MIFNKLKKMLGLKPKNEVMEVEGMEDVSQETSDEPTTIRKFCEVKGNKVSFVTRAGKERKCGRLVKITGQIAHFRPNKGKESPVIPRMIA
jgi:hypothetical protein